MKEIQKGQKIKVAGGGELEVVQKLGEGGQGIVYKVRFNGKDLALKWYFPAKLQNKADFYKNVQDNIKLSAPSPVFLWPLAITDYWEGSFGYVMNLRPPEFKDFSRFLLAKERFSSVGAVISAALSIVNAFRLLHNKGYSYQDLNDGNFFVNPRSGEVLICDNDNVAPYGKNLGIAGKCRYMAPEVVVGHKLPDIHTDRFSLSVVLYLLLFLNHPLEGKRTLCPCLTEELERKYYGSEPVFVWDPKNDSNRPVRGVHSNAIRLWPLYPKFVREAFERAFSKEAMIGSDTAHRINEKEWQEIFTNLLGLTIPCACGSETFFDPEGAKTCIHCGKSLDSVLVLKVKKYRAALFEGAKIYQCHTKHDSNDFKEATGEVVKNKMNPSILGLRNDTNAVWDVDGARKGKGEVIKIARGVKINFGDGNLGEII